MMTIDHTAFDGVDDLRDGGTLSRTLDGYTERAAQIEMAGIVAHALDAQHHAVIEAGTGTGKSHGYLLPLVRSGKKAIISTANKALQEQLFYKDIPFVQQHVQPFMAVIMKGMGNYLCLDRWKEYHSQLLPEEEASAEMMLAAITEALSEDSQWDGDFETLGLEVPGEYARRDQCGP